MGIESKHSYRFEFLKSDRWKDIRLAIIAKAEAKCKICGKIDWSNDVHHITYPKNIWQDEHTDTIVLCRGCHEELHRLVDNFKHFKCKSQRSIIQRMTDKKLHPKQVMDAVKNAKTPWHFKVLLKQHCACCGDKNFQITKMFPAMADKPQFSLPLCPSCSKQVLDHCGTLVTDKDSAAFREMEKVFRKIQDSKIKPVRLDSFDPMI